MNKTMSTSSLAMPYHRFVDLQKQLANVEAIDYFFAKQFAEILLQPEHGGDRNRNTTEFDTYLTEYTTVLFHLLVALSVSLREGHSCLPLSAIANQRFGYSCDSVGIISHQGFHFPNLEQLNNMLTALSLNHCLVDGVDLAENHTGSFQNEENQQQQQGIIYHHEKLYLRRYFLFEQQVIGFIKSHHHSDTITRFTMDKDGIIFRRVNSFIKLLNGILAKASNINRNINIFNRHFFHRHRFVVWQRFTVRQ